MSLGSNYSDEKRNGGYGMLPPRSLWLMAAAIFVGSIAWAVLQWNECRDMGFSVLYCIQHIA